MEEVRTTKEEEGVIFMTQNYAAMIDHTLLKAETTKAQIEKFVRKH